jgi:hypothetical protein
MIDVSTNNRVMNGQKRGVSSVLPDLLTLKTSLEKTPYERIQYVDNVKIFSKAYRNECTWKKYHCQDCDSFDRGAVMGHLDCDVNVDSTILLSDYVEHLHAIN